MTSQMKCLCSSSGGKFDNPQKISFKTPNSSASLGISLTGGNATGIFIETIFSKRHLLLNYLWEFYQTSQEWSLGGPPPKLFKWF